MLDQTSLLARVLHGAGIRQNDVVSIVSENRFEYPAVVFGAFYLSAVVSPISTNYSERKIDNDLFGGPLNLILSYLTLGEYAHSLQLSKPRFVFTSFEYAERTCQVCRKLKFVEKVIVFGRKNFSDRTILYHDFVKRYEQKDFNVERHVAQRVARDQVAYVANSSGTTGLQKGVLITQENIMSIVQVMRDALIMSKQLLGRSVVSSTVAPWFHAMGFCTMIINACSRDNTFVFLPKYENKSFLSSIEEYKTASISVVPPIMVFLAKSPMFDQYDLSSLTGMIVINISTLTNESSRF